MRLASGLPARKRSNELSYGALAGSSAFAAAMEATGVNAAMACGMCANTHIATAQGNADEQPESDLADDKDNEIVDAVVVRSLDPCDQPQRERDRHRIVAAGLGFKGPGKPPANVRKPQRRKDGGGIG
jgi:hypothetical protein